MQPDTFIRATQLRAITGLSRTTVWRLEKTGQFPQRRKIGVKSVAWLQSEIVAWMHTRTTVGEGKS